MSVSSRRYDVDRRLPGDEIAAVLAVHLVDRPAHLALHAVEPAAHVLHLVLQLQHLLHTGEVEAELVRQLLDQPQALEIQLGVEARVPLRPLRPDQAPALVDAQRLRMHADEVGRDGDHVARAVVHHSPRSLKRRSCSSLRRINTNVTTMPTEPTLTRMTAA